MIGGSCVSDLGADHTVFRDYKTAMTGPGKRICIGGNGSGKKSRRRAGIEVRVRASETVTALGSRAEHRVQHVMSGEIGKGAEISGAGSRLVSNLSAVNRAHRRLG